MTTQATSSLPDCYGRLEQVFPKSSADLRQIRQQCWACETRVECLRQAMSSSSTRAQVKAEQASPALGGVMGFLQRWSNLKQQNLQKKDKA